MELITYIWVKYYKMFGFAAGSVSLASLLEFGTTFFGFLGAFFGMLIAGISLYRLLFSDREKSIENQQKRREKLKGFFNSMQGRRNL
jgi:hypothetical protein